MPDLTFGGLRWIAFLTNCSNYRPALTAYRLQLERPDGSRLTLALPSLDAAALNALCADFLKNEPDFHRMAATMWLINPIFEFAN
jgi:hypothetical protein